MTNKEYVSKYKGSIVKLKDLHIEAILIGYSHTTAIYAFNDGKNNKINITDNAYIRAYGSANYDAYFVNEDDFPHVRANCYCWTVDGIDMIKVKTIDKYEVAALIKALDL